jgi:hypothetical protein
MRKRLASYAADSAGDAPRPDLALERASDDESQNQAGGCGTMHRIVNPDVDKSVCQPNAPS